MNVSDTPPQMSKVREKASSPHQKNQEDTENGKCDWQLVLGSLLTCANMLIRLYCGFYMIISDCDETYNYWEPLNLIFRGFGKQTWEYSPTYAIRSYAYLIPYYLATSPIRDLNYLSGSTFPAYYNFYYIRVFCLCGFTSFVELKLFKSVKKNFGSHAGNWYLLYTTFAPGMSHAGVALLPSSFAMGWSTWGAASALSSLTSKNDISIVQPTVHAITCFLVAGLVGWPFALIIGVPFGLYTIKARFQTSSLILIVFFCAISFVSIFSYILLTDSFVYDRKMLFVPFNIVLYNVFPISGEGPEIFGVEPFIYYVKNLFLNFNIVSGLGYLGILLNGFLCKQRQKVTFGVSLPVVLWSVIFFRQPHKEERFLYPIYSFICLSAALFTSCVFAKLQLVCNYKTLTKFLLVSLMFVYVTTSILRILNLTHNYSAPLSVAQALHKESLSETGNKNVCIGREWYHFPASFFLPDNYRLRFVASGFDGLLPGDFPENVTLSEAASAYPSGMNSRNVYSPDKVVLFDSCDYYLDNTLPTTKEEPWLINTTEEGEEIRPGWKVIKCQDMIKPEGDHVGIGRLLYIPKIVRPVIPYKVEQMKYCLLKKDSSI